MGPHISQTIKTCKAFFQPDGMSSLLTGQVTTQKSFSTKPQNEQFIYLANKFIGRNWMIHCNWPFKINIADYILWMQKLWTFLMKMFKLTKPSVFSHRKFKWSCRDVHNNTTTKNNKRSPRSQSSTTTVTRRDRQRVLLKETPTLTNTRPIATTLQPSRPPPIRHLDHFYFFLARKTSESTVSERSAALRRARPWRKRMSR
jgi:hypothetical protein